jgi:hypothetical protein
MSYASVDDVQVSLGRSLTTDETAQAEGLLDRIETRINRKLDLAAALAADAGLVDILVEVEADAVARVLLNPSGYLQEQDGDYMYTRDRSVASGRLDLTSDEWARLGVKRGAFTIAPYLGRTPDVAPWQGEDDFL